MLGQPSLSDSHSQPLTERFQTGSRGLSQASSPSLGVGLVKCSIIEAYQPPFLSLMT